MLLLANSLLAGVMSANLLPVKLLSLKRLLDHLTFGKMTFGQVTLNLFYIATAKRKLAKQISAEKKIWPNFVKKKVFWNFDLKILKHICSCFHQTKERFFLFRSLKRTSQSLNNFRLTTLLINLDRPAATRVAQSVKRPELRSLKEVQLNWREFDSRSHHRS